MTVIDILYLVIVSILVGVGIYFGNRWRSALKEAFVEAEKMSREARGYMPDENRLDELEKRMDRAERLLLSKLRW